MDIFALVAFVSLVAPLCIFNKHAMDNHAQVMKYLKYYVGLNTFAFVMYSYIA